MEDYKEEIRNLLLKYYHNAGEEHKLLQRTTSEVLNEVRGLIPKHPIDEHDIYDLLKEMLFEQAQKIIYENVCTFEGDEKQGIPPEYEKVEIGRIFVWNVYQK
ncbi:MAG: hypothetical protein KA871_04440 [Cloacibacterium sp.]|nr:hypothetical protein [Cloacibacterium sp.]